MNEGLARLKEIGVQKIYEDTHISRQNIEAILDETYGEMLPVQVGGFISIMEREYSVDLTTLKEKYEEDIKDLSVKISVKVSSSDMERPRAQRRVEDDPKSWKWLIVVLLAVVVIIVFVMTGEDANEQLLPPDKTPVAAMQEGVPGSDPESIGESVRKISDEVTPATSEVNASEAAGKASVALPEVSQVPEVLEEAATPTTYFTIVPKTKLWMGIIDITTKKRKVRITENRVDLNASKPWLLVFGHGHFDIENGEEHLKFKRQTKIRILFEDGMAYEIDKAEYKARNEGKNW